MVVIFTKLSMENLCSYSHTQSYDSKLSEYVNIYWYIHGKNLVKIQYILIVAKLSSAEA